MRIFNARHNTPNQEAKMNTVRLNITLPMDIATKLDSLAGPRGKSSFIAECIQERLLQIEQQKLKNLLKEGYQNTKAESLALAKEFEPVDLEGWDEY
jgi:metal-responsive CopG/Arc/MetJ family transcriptional regulator